MTTHYAVIVVPDAHRNAMNRVLNILWSDEGDNLQRQMSPAATPLLPSHWFCGLPVSPEMANVLQNLAANTPSPVGGWPWMDVTETDAEAATASLYLNINSGEGSLGAMAAQNVATVAAALELVVYEEPI